MKWLIIWAKGARIGSFELTAANLAYFQGEFYLSRIQVDQDGHEHWEAIAPRRKCRRS